MAAATTPPVAPSPASGIAALSEGARIVNTFIAPSKTFTDLRRSAAWWAPWILISVCVLALNITMSKQVGFDQIARNLIEKSPKQSQAFDRLQPEQQAAQIKAISAGNKYASYAAPALIPLFCLIAMLPLWLTLKFMGGDTTFSQGFAIVMYAWLPGIIGAILGTVSLYSGVNPEGFDIQNPVGTNLGYYLDAETVGRFVKGLATGLDVLVIWSLILIGIGFACTSKVKRSTAIAVVVVWYLVFKISFSALGAL
jgi:hypothetical protein